MRFLWDFYGISMEFLWDAWDFCAISMEFWFRDGIEIRFSMGFELDYMVIRDWWFIWLGVGKHDCLGNTRKTKGLREPFGLFLGGNL